MVQKFNYLDLSAEVVEKIAEILRKGGVGVLPTETVYGLFCAFDNDVAAQKIYEIKGRPKEKVLSLTLSNLNSLEEYVEVEEWQLKTISHFLPGPVTFVLKSKSGLPSHLVSGEGKTGIRIPSLTVLQEIIESHGKPLASTSANTSGKPAPFAFEKVEKEILENVEFALDFGECPVKLPSTVYDLSFFPGKVIREGLIKQEEIVNVAREFYDRD